MHEPHSSNFKKAFLVFFHTYTYIILGLFSSALLLRSILPFKQELRAARVLWKAFLVFFRLKKLLLTSPNVHIHNIPFKPELQIALDCTPKLFAVHLMRCTNCESNDPLTHMAVNILSLMRCNIRSVNSIIRAARALNDPYESEELKLYSTDRNGT